MKKRGDYTTIEEYVLAVAGKPIEALNTYKKWEVNLMDKVAMFFIDMAKKGDKTPIFVYSDADCDGINSSDELLRLLKGVLKLNVQMYVPLKFTDGYGITKRFVEILPKGCILVTIDNGIAAIEPLQIAAGKNITTIVLDHHLATETGELPIAHMIVDPEAFPESVSTGFDQLCAGGLAFELTEKVAELAPEFFGTGEQLDLFMTQQAVFAANATAGDSMTLLEENRRIMQLGLDAIHKKKAPYTISKIIELNGESAMSNYCSKDMSFDLAPKTNATARLEDHGARKTAIWFMQSGLDGDEAAAVITDNNTRRKHITADAVKEMTFDESAPINFVCLENKEQYRGLFGLMAGKCVELNGKPSFICGTTSDGRVVGSARSNDGAKNNVKKMIDFCKKTIPMAGGGHPAAAGYSFNKEDVSRVFEKLCEYPIVKMTEEDLEKKWDLLLKAEEAADTRVKLDLAEPFGKDFEAPVFKLVVDKADIMYMKEVHVKLRNINGTMLDAVIFNCGDQFREHGSAKCNLYGTLVWNEYKGIKKAQFMADEFEFVA